jgi:hypothetical protein
VFDQEAWLKPFIDFNTAKRQRATTDFEKDFFKLLSNSVYGKSMENLRKRIDFNFRPPSSPSSHPQPMG